jgi:hypothetical protein
MVTQDQETKLPCSTPRGTGVGVFQTTLIPLYQSVFGFMAQVDVEDALVVVEQDMVVVAVV